jgi:hypothetical protein
MRRLVMGLAISMAIACGAWAQGAPAPPPPGPNPVKMDLARQLVEASGGEAQAEAQMKLVFNSMRANLAKTLSGEKAAMADAVYDEMSRELVTLTPRILDISVKAYADEFTVQELRDLLAFQISESGRSMVRKMPALRAQIMNETLPLIMSSMPEVMRKSADIVCARQHCTAEQRDAIVNAFGRAGARTAN